MRAYFVWKFCAKNSGAKTLLEKSSTKHFHTKKLLIKCWWIWHLLSLAVSSFVKWRCRLVSDDTNDDGSFATDDDSNGFNEIGGELFRGNVGREFEDVFWNVDTGETSPICDVAGGKTEVSICNVFAEKSPTRCWMSWNVNGVSIWACPVRTRQNIRIAWNNKKSWKFIILICKPWRSSITRGVLGGLRSPSFRVLLFRQKNLRPKFFNFFFFL